MHRGLYCILAKNYGAVLVLHTPNIKYIFEINLGIICIAVGKTEKKIWKA